MAMQVQSIKCPECGATLTDSAGKGLAFCSYCGARLAITDENESVFRIVDEADITRAETERMVASRRLDILEREQQMVDEEVSKAVKSVEDLTAARQEADAQYMQQQWSVIQAEESQPQPTKAATVGFMLALTGLVMLLLTGSKNVLLIFVTALQTVCFGAAIVLKKGGKHHVIGTILSLVGYALIVAFVLVFSR